MAEGKEILEAAAGAALGELAGLAPGGSTALAVVQAVFAHCADRRARELFAAIAESIGAEDWTAAAGILGEHIGKPWFDETLERGFRDIIESVCPESRRCLGFLVADFFRKQKSPDSAFRKAATLLRESTAAELRTFLMLCEMQEQVPDPIEGDLCVLVRGERRSHWYGRFWFVVLRGETGDLGARVVEPANLEECTRTIVAHRIGSNWSGLGDHRFEGNPILRFNDEDRAVFRLLRTCLHALNHQRNAPDGATATGSLSAS
ncbi:MAG: hypothetical protein AB7V19_05865 [Candidatus Bipolaricaulia bacterium]